MKLQPTSPMQQLRNEKGSYLLIIAACGFAILTILGLAIDVGNLTLHQLRLQRAADAAATGGAFRLGQLNSSAVRTVARNILEDNLRQTKVAFNSGDIQVNVRSEDVTIDAVTDVPLLILSAIPGFGDRESVAASAQAQRVRIIVCLAVDVSGSMAGTKIENLKSAAKSFVNQFSETDDQIALVSYSTRGTVRKPMQNAFVKRDLNAIIDGLSAGGFTNISEGVRLCGNEIDLAYNPSTARKALVVISDGAPTTNGSGSCGNGSYPCAGLYTDAIQESDTVRQRSKPTFYAIGLGVGNGIINDPYQNANDSNSLKPILLRRVVNDRNAGALDPSFPQVPNFAQISADPQGQYFETPNAEDLERLLLTIGKSIKARLVK